MNRRLRASFALAAMLAGCGGGGGGSVTPPPSTPAPSPLSLSASSLSINAVGANKQVTVSETGYTGAFSWALGTCGTIVSVNPGSVQGPQGTFTFSGTAAGSCTATISDAAGQKQNVAITVTSTTGSLQ